MKVAGLATGLLVAATSVNAAVLQRDNIIGEIVADIGDVIGAAKKTTTTTTSSTKKTTTTSSSSTKKTTTTTSTTTSSAKKTTTTSSSTTKETSTSTTAAAAKITSLSELSSPSTVISILESIISTVFKTVSAGTALSFSGGNPFDIVKTTVSDKRYTHDLTWTEGPKTNNGDYVNWTTYDGNGVNIGCWLELEYSCYEDWWASLGTTAIDEWDLCEQLGDDCASVMNEHYASFINTTSIDAVAAVGVNTLRIPTTYAAWVDVPGSQFYHGDQTTYLKTITDYAIETYGMHIVVGLHSLPGGVNDLDIGEAYNHDAWFYNSTNLAYSLQAIETMLTWIVDSGHENSFTIEPINEAADDFANFGTCEGLTTDGAAYVAAYINMVLQIVEKVNVKIPVMLQECFCGESFWSSYFNSTANLVIDTHVYYFADSGVYSEYVAPAVCGQAETLAGDGIFPVFVGEWALQVTYNNTFDERATIFDTQRYSWSENGLHGGAFWNMVHYGNATVSGQGDQEDYWSYIGLIEAGVITSKTNASYC